MRIPYVIDCQYLIRDGHAKCVTTSGQSSTSAPYVQFYELKIDNF